MLLNGGLNGVRDVLSTTITYGKLGTGGTAAVASDTDLLAEVANTELALTSVETSDRTLKFNYTFGFLLGLCNVNVQPFSCPYF